MSSTELVAPAAVVALRSDAMRSQLKAALPADVSVDKFVRVALTTLREQPELLEADQRSLFAAIVRCAQDGLYPDRHEAALVQFKDKKRGKVAVYLPMIGGYRKIAAEYGWSIRTVTVRAGDEFEYEEGLDPILRHRPAPLSDDRGELVGAYAIGTHRDGRKMQEVMGRQEIEKIRGTSRAAEYGPWVDWPERMWEKTVGRRLFKKLALDPTDRRVVHLIDADELDDGEAVEALYEISGPSNTTPDEPEMAEGGDSGEDRLDEPPPPSSAPSPGETLLPRGRHEGRTIASVWEEDPGYVHWVSSNWPDQEAREAAKRFIAELDA